jgi:hypothetical protein
VFELGTSPVSKEALQCFTGEEKQTERLSNLIKLKQWKWHLDLDHSDVKSACLPTLAQLYHSFSKLFCIYSQCPH